MATTLSTASMSSQSQFVSNGLLDDDDDDEEEQDQLQEDNHQQQPAATSNSDPSTSTSTSVLKSISNSPKLTTPDSISSAKSALNNLGRRSTSPSTSTFNPSPNPPRVKPSSFHEDEPNFDLDRELELEEEEIMDMQKGIRGGNQMEMEMDEDELQAMLESEDQAVTSISSKDKGKGKQLVLNALQSNGLLDDDDGYEPPSTARPPTSYQQPKAKPKGRSNASIGIYGAGAETSAPNLPNWAKETGGRGRGRAETSTRIGGSNGVGSSKPSSRQAYAYQAPRNHNGTPKYIPAGMIDAITFEGTTIRFDRRRRMKGWKVS